jgi:HK97 family phage major capsid protein
MEKLIEEKKELIIQLETKLNELNESKTPELKAEYEALETQVESIDFKIAEMEKVAEVELPAKITEEELKEDKQMEKNIKELITEAIDTSSNVAILLPSTVDAKIVQKRDEGSFMRKYASVSNADGNSIIPVEGSPVEAGFGAEIAAITESDATFDTVEMKANKVGTLVKVSEDALMNAGFDLEGELVGQMGRAIANVENVKFILGTGVGEPTGITKSIVAGNTVNSVAATLAWADIETTYFGLKEQYRTNATWLMNSKTLKAVKALLTDDGYQNHALTEVLGKHVQVAESMPDVAVGKTPIIFADLAYYKIMDRTSFEIKPLNELYAVTSQKGFLGSTREDAHFVLAEAMTALKIHA